MNEMFYVYLVCSVLLITIGLYTLLVSRNLIRMLIGFEIMTKGATLALISAGAANGRLALSQAMTLTVIVVEVVFIAVAVALVMLAQRKNKSLDVRKLTKLKG